MKKSIILKTILISFFCIYVNNLYASEEKIIKWKLQASYPIGTTMTMHAEEWAKKIEILTNGRLKVEIFAPGAMAGPLDILTYLQRGVFDCAQTSGVFFIGDLPEGDIELGLPMSWQSYDEVWDAMENRGLKEVFKEAYAEKNIEFFYCGADPYYNLATTFPVNTLNDIKGRKIRALGIYGKFIQALGGSAVVIPGGEMYMAMKLGTIDGAIYGASSLTVQKIYEVADYYVMPTFASVCVNLLVNKKSIENLPKDIKNIVLNATQYILHDSTMKYAQLTKHAINSTVLDGTMKLSYLSEPELIKMRKIVAPLWDEVASKNERTKKGVNIIKQQMKDYGRAVE